MVSGAAPRRATHLFAKPQPILGAFAHSAHSARHAASHRILRAALPNYCSATPVEATPHALLPPGATGRLARTLGVTRTLACALGYAPSPDALQPVTATCSAYDAAAGSWTVGAQRCARMLCTLLFSDCLLPPLSPFSLTSLSSELGRI